MELNNKYYILRHGEALSNIKKVASSWPETFENPITDKGREQIKKAAKDLINKNIDLIFASDLLRTRQTAEIIGREIKIEPKFDERLREIIFGVLNGRPIDLWYAYQEKNRVSDGPENSENYEKVTKRVEDFLKDVDKRYRNKNILIVSHECPLTLLEWKIKGISVDEGIKKFPEKSKRIKKGEIRELN